METNEDSGYVLDEDGEIGGHRTKKLAEEAD